MHFCTDELLALGTAVPAISYALCCLRCKLAKKPVCSTSHEEPPPCPKSKSKSPPPSASLP